MRGKFISVEGSEGAGKSTSIRHIATYLRKQGFPVVETREPGGTKYGEQIRELLLNHNSEPLAPLAELLLILAARAQHIQTKIEPALASGSWVISDRFADATLAYQGAGRALDPSLILSLNRTVCDGFDPDLTLILDVPVAIGMDRVKKRAELDRFERETKEFFERIRRSYLDLAALNPKRCRLIDANRPQKDVSMSVEAELNALIATAKSI